MKYFQIRHKIINYHVSHFALSWVFYVCLRLLTCATNAFTTDNFLYLFIILDSHADIFCIILASNAGIIIFLN